MAGPSCSVRRLAAPHSVGPVATTSAHGSVWRVNRRSSLNFGRSNADDIVRGATTLIFIADGDAAVSSAERHGIDAHILADKERGDVDSAAENMAGLLLPRNGSVWCQQ